MFSMYCIDENIALFIKIYLIVSPFVILYLYRRAKEAKLINLALSNTESVFKNDTDYKMLLDAYGSVANYEDCRMKDFEIMRNYLKNVSACLDEIITDLNKFLLLNSHLDNNIKSFLDNMLFSYKQCKYNLDLFISSEEEAHSEHTREEVLEFIERRKEENEKENK